MRTSNMGWRVVAGGVGALILGLAALEQHFAWWITLPLLIVGIVGMVVGRQL